ncbi:UNKNOWN [Stylonychia lemnae]|uniref:Uncharacterized protein n=1 Tax=Stylonychia lemnae TaxID=5949 RepID=A0A078B4Y3_STYLE|nr:UNKNOWN [Stylonychia lemnae]|eukprot:CDW88598.1 UNKNOWN [Stylonychia lemnae]
MDPDNSNSDSRVVYSPRLYTQQSYRVPKRRVSSNQFSDSLSFRKTVIQPRYFKVNRGNLLIMEQQESENHHSPANKGKNHKESLLRSIFLNNHLNTRQRSLLNQQYSPTAAQFNQSSLLPQNSGQSPFTQTVHGFTKTIFHIPLLTSNSKIIKNQHLESNPNGNYNQDIQLTQTSKSEGLEQMRQFVNDYPVQDSIVIDRNSYSINKNDEQLQPKPTRLVYLPQRCKQILVKAKVKQDQMQYYDQMRNNSQDKSKSYTNLKSQSSRVAAQFTPEKPQPSSIISHLTLLSHTNTSRPATQSYLRFQRQNYNTNNEKSSIFNCKVLESIKSNIKKSETVKQVNQMYQQIFQSTQDYNNVFDRNKRLLQALKDIEHNNEDLKPENSLRQSFGGVSIRGSLDRNQLIQKSNNSSKLQKRKKEVMIQKQVNTGIRNKSDTKQKQDNSMHHSPLPPNQKAYKLVFVDGNENAMKFQDQNDIRKEVADFLDYKQKLSKKNHNIMRNYQTGEIKVDSIVPIHNQTQIDVVQNESKKPIQFDREFYEKMAHFDMVISSSISQKKLTDNLTLNLNEQSQNDLSNTSDLSHIDDNRYASQHTLSVENINKDS